MTPTREIIQYGFDVEFFCSRVNLPCFPNVVTENWEIFQDYAASEVKTTTEYYTPMYFACAAESVKRSIIELPYNISFADVVNFDPKAWAEIPPKMRRLGCGPDKNLYDLETEKKRYASQSMRTAGGHIHIGTNPHLDKGHVAAKRDIDVEAMVRNLDATLALSAVIYNRRKQEERRRIYGMPGTYREKPYGLEYRTLCNGWWIRSSITRMTADLLNDTVKHTLRSGSMRDENNQWSVVGAILGDDPFVAYEELIQSIDKLSISDKDKEDYIKFHEYLLNNPVTDNQLEIDDQDWRNF